MSVGKIHKTVLKAFEIDESMRDNIAAEVSLSRFTILEATQWQISSQPHRFHLWELAFVWELTETFWQGSLLHSSISSLVIVKHSCSKLSCQKVFGFKIFPCKSLYQFIWAREFGAPRLFPALDLTNLYYTRSVPT